MAKILEINLNPQRVYQNKPFFIQIKVEDPQEDNYIYYEGELLLFEGEPIIYEDN